MDAFCEVGAKDPILQCSHYTQWNSNRWSSGTLSKMKQNWLTLEPKKSEKWEP